MIVPGRSVSGTRFPGLNIVAFLLKMKTSFRNYWKYPLFSKCIYLGKRTTETLRCSHIPWRFRSVCTYAESDLDRHFSWKLASIFMKFLISCRHWNRNLHVVNTKRLILRLQVHAVSIPLNFTLYRKKWGLQENTLFFLNFAQNIDYGCLLESPHWGGSNKHPQSMFGP